MQVAKDGSLARRRAHHVRVQRAVQRRLPRHPAPRRRVDRPASRVTENGRAYRPGGCTELGCTDAAGTFGTTHGRATPSASSGTTRRRRAPHVHGALPPAGASPSPTTTSSTSISRSGAPNGRSRSAASRRPRSAPGKVLTRLGPPRLRPRRRPARRDEGAAARARRARGPVRRAAHGDPARGVQLDGRDAGRRGQRPREDRRRGDGRRRRVREGPASGSTTRSSIRGATPSTCSCSARCRRSSSSARVFWFYGRERKTGYDREYEQEPPTETEPALVPTLLRQGGEAGSFEFTATLFDLIRRGVFTSTPVTTERSTWGGLRSENVSDLELAAGQGRREALTPWENAVARVVDGRDRGRPGAAVALPRADRGRPDGDEQALHVVQGERRHRGRQPQVVHLPRRRAARPLRSLAVRRARSAADLRRRRTAGARSTRAGATSS